MRQQILLAFILAAVVPGLSQSAASSTTGLPEDPGGVFGTFSPSYDYSAFKPWHLKATYQLSDDAGKPVGQGSYEYWWASPQTFRSTWTRGDASYTEWHMADGKVARQGTSEAFSYFERKLGVALVSPLTAVGELDPAQFRLDDHGLSAKHSVVTCFDTVPAAQKAGPVPPPGSGLFPSYCFNTSKQILLGIYSFGTMAMQYNDFTRFQGKSLARIFSFHEGTRFFLTAKIDETSELSPTDPALMPPESAKPERIDRVKIDANLAEAILVKKVPPVYPKDAKDAHIEGKVVLRAILGIDGRVCDLLLLSAPKPSLAFSAFRSVSQWEYKPYLRNGEPVEVETTVTVTYSLGQ